MSSLRFRNVDADPLDPVEQWPLEALRSSLERGDLDDYRRIVAAITAEPWGDVARRCEEVLEWTAPYGVARMITRSIDRARERWIQQERAWVCEQLQQALCTSGLSRTEFARRLGTSPSRLSTYLRGSVVPSATVLARAQAVAQGASRRPTPTTSTRRSGR